MTTQEETKEISFVSEASVVDYNSAREYMDYENKKEVKLIRSLFRYGGMNLSHINDEIMSVTYGPEIHLEKHSVPMVSYLKDGTQIIFPIIVSMYGRRNTYLRQNLISRSSFIRDIVPDKGNLKLCLHSDGLTDVKQQKCRACKGIGKLIGFCTGVKYCWDKDLCSIAEKIHNLQEELDNGVGFKERYHEIMNEMGSLKHYHELCPHGMHNSHTTWSNATECVNCNGVGKAEYGGKSKGVELDLYKPTIIDPNGLRVEYSTLDEIPEKALQALVLHQKYYEVSMRRLRKLGGPLDLTQLAQLLNNQ
jgi:hypothetical protein